MLNVLLGLFLCLNVKYWRLPSLVDFCSSEWILLMFSDTGNGSRFSAYTLNISSYEKEKSIGPSAGKQVAELF